MSIRSFLMAFLALPFVSMPAGTDTVPLCEPWPSQYQGSDAASEHVIAFWPFSQGSELEDASGKGHSLSIEGATLQPDGHFGACIESHPGWPIEDVRHAARTTNAPDLSPGGPFTLEMWIQLKAEVEGYNDSFLLDKKYVAHTDYQLILLKPKKKGLRSLRACLGFGDGSESFDSDLFRSDPGIWSHVAFAYDGAGTGCFFVNGHLKGRVERPGRGKIRPGTHPLSIGDRLGSNFCGFPGLIDEVRICAGALEFRRAGWGYASSRTSFRRMERDCVIALRLTNFQRESLQGAKAWVSLSGLGPQEMDIPNLQPGQSHEVIYPLDTSIRPGAYEIQASLSASEGEEERFPVVLVPRRPARFPVVQWGIYSPGEVLKEMDRLKDLGFTHVLGLSADCDSIWQAGQPVSPGKPESVTQTQQVLNEALVQDLGILATLSPGSARISDKQFLRVNRGGQPYPRPDICGLFPELRSYCFNVGASVAQAYGAFPAFEGALIHTEVRDNAELCFHEIDREAFRSSSGFDIPPEVMTKHGLSWEKLSEKPVDGILPDDHPVLVYYRWFWKEGDGWNALTRAVAEGLKTSKRQDFWTFTDPAVRVASVYGSGQGMDVISHWTYSYPDPIRIAIATDELMAMAQGSPTPQKVMKMTQIIWYRSQTAPQRPGEVKDKSVSSPWEDTDPDADFITIAPMHLREAFWTKISRPISGIMYHGWQSLVPSPERTVYRYTHPETQNELRRLIRDVLDPLGPTLLQLPEAKSDVWVLESFASQMFAGRGTYGWGGSWLGDVYHVLHYAGLQPRIVFDETLVSEGLEGCRVLVLPDCDVLTRTVKDRIQGFHKAGGLVVGDTHLASAIEPDIRLKVRERGPKADENKRILLDLAGQLRTELDGRYSRYVDSSNPEVIAHLRQSGTTDYIFAINDRREFGDYVGQHGLVMENGLPASADLSVRRNKTWVYDLLSSRAVDASRCKKATQLHVEIEPCGGALFMMTDRPISQVRIKAPETVKRGDSAAVKIAIADEKGDPIDAVIPLRVLVEDSETREAEFSGTYAALKGELTLHLDIAPNDPRGVWRIQAEELASGLQSVQYFRVE